MPEKPTPQFFTEQKKRCPQCGGSLPCSTHSGELKQETEKVEMNLIQSETLYEAQQNERIGTITVAPDGTHWSAIIEGENKIRANCVNGVVEDWYDEVSSVKFSPSGHYVYIARDAYLNIEPVTIYKDGKKVTIGGDITPLPIGILYDGRTVISTNKEEDDHTKYYLYVENEIIAESDDEIQELNASGNHYACVLTKELPHGKTVQELIYDGEPKIEADVIDRFVLQDNGEALAYAVRNRLKTAGNKEQQEATIYVNDEVYEQIPLGPNEELGNLWISKTGKRVAYRVLNYDASGNETVSTYLDHEKAPYDVQEVTFSPNEENMLVIASDNTGDKKRSILLLNGKEIIEEENVWSCGFLDNETWYASCREGGDRWMVINHIEGEHFSYVYTPKQSPDKKHIAYIAHNQKGSVFSCYVVINNETKPLPFNRVNDIRFSDDGKSLHVFGREDNTAVKKTFSLNTTEPNHERALPAQKQY